ncbi:MAG: tRNA1(Val) (adenine(37)-N6)-methyltransferase [Deltaproteobacteria bacterium]|nr:tRNA1(Val) (adenine(37)-N6)-methyltransferase [Deltaproteobacteria bacterium]
MKRRSYASRPETLDTLFQGRLAIMQRRDGYRFSLDAVLLSHFVKLAGHEKIVDLGTGNGVIPLILASCNPSVLVTGLELQDSMVERAERNVRLNRLEPRVRIIRGDVCRIEQLFPPRSFDLVVANPPYRRIASGRINPDREKSLARHEIRGCLRDFIRAGFYLLPPGEKMDLVYPASRLSDLFNGMRAEGMEPKRLRIVHSYAESAATLLLVEGVKGAKSELKIMPPLIVYAKGKEYSPELKTILEGNSR